MLNPAKSRMNMGIFVIADIEVRITEKVKTIKGYYIILKR